MRKGSPAMRRGADSITCRRTGGAQVRCPAGRDRRVGVPPVWKHVWTASDHRAHIPATGVDAAGHPWYLCQLRWRELRDDEKCKRSLAFAQSPPPMCICKAGNYGCCSAASRQARGSCICPTTCWELLRLHGAHPVLWVCVLTATLPIGVSSPCLHRERLLRWSASTTALCRPC